MVNKHMKRFSNLYVLRGLQIRTRYTSCILEWLKSNPTKAKADEGVKPQEVASMRGEEKALGEGIWQLLTDCALLLHGPEIPLSGVYSK